MGIFTPSPAHVVHPEHLLFVQLLQYEPLERLDPPRVALVQPCVQLNVLPFDQTERRRFSDLPQRSQKVKRLGGDGVGVFGQ
jgi:hypothetical protein